MVIDVRDAEHRDPNNEDGTSEQFNKFAIEFQIGKSMYSHRFPNAESDYK
jgi:hypothetical protein